MNAQWIKVKAEDGEYEAYLSLPPAGKGPGLVLFQEIFGVNSHIRGVADQYALSGFVVLAPDVFWRQAPRIELGYTSADVEQGRGLAGGLKPAQGLVDIGTTVKALRARPEVSTGKVGAIGYCMGGRFAYLAAATAGVDAASCFYGGAIQDNLDKASSITCPIQFHYGERDKVIPAEAREKVAAAMSGKRAEIFVYPADHGFNCWDRASYEPRSSAQAQARSLAHFAEYLY
jgi:carboxymethylenebutenolidase